MVFPKHVLLLDIETTGLKREQDHIICIGLTYLNAVSKLQTEHWFLDHPEEEKALLERFLTFISDYEALFTYYGRGFEFPFIQARLKQYQLNDTAFMTKKLIDMRPALKAFNAKRSDLEARLHFQRHFQSSGEDMVKLYRTYTQTGAEIYKTCILAHQSEELQSLLLFFELYLSFYHSKDWILEKQLVEEQSLSLVVGTASPFLTDFEGFLHGMQIRYHKNETFFCVTIPIYKGSLSHALTPIKDYYYIESQKELMHKSLAQFIPSSLKRKATADECVVTKESRFIEIFSNHKLTSPLWKDLGGKLYLETTDYSLDVFRLQSFDALFHSKKEGMASLERF